MIDAVKAALLAVANAQKALEVSLPAVVGMFEVRLAANTNVPFLNNEQYARVGAMMSICALYHD